MEGCPQLSPASTRCAAWCAEALYMHSVVSNSVPQPFLVDAPRSNLVVCHSQPVFGCLVLQLDV
eukprot:1137851-Pelagomonas_calceolata.AAC.6